MIALDYAGKYTHKDKEKENPDYDKIVSQFETAANLQLLSESLHQMESLGFLGLREQRMISGMSITEIILSW